MIRVQPKSSIMSCFKIKCALCNNPTATRLLLEFDQIDLDSESDEILIVFLCKMAIFQLKITFQEYSIHFQTEPHQ